MNNVSLKYRFQNLSIAEKLIAINVAVYILVGLISFLFQVPSYWFTKWFHLPQNFTDWIFKPWTIVSYAFIHGGLWHLVFNMLMLFYVSRLFLNLFTVRQFINVYFLGAIAGGLFFVLAYNVFPVFMQKDTALVGASAAVMAILIFIATYMPNTEVMVFMFRIKLWHIGLFFVVLDLVLIPSNNAGGRIAHLGGSLLGYLYASQLRQGVDIGAGFGKLIDGVTNLFARKRKQPFTKVYKSPKPKSTVTRRKPEPSEKQQKIDAILDKISKSGYDSLSQEEKDFLFQSGRE